MGVEGNPILTLSSVSPMYLQCISSAQPKLTTIASPLPIPAHNPHLLGFRLKLGGGDSSSLLFSSGAERRLASENS